MLPLATQAEEQAVANTVLETANEIHTREALEDATRLTNELELAVKRKLMPISGSTNSSATTRTPW